TENLSTLMQMTLKDSAGQTYSVDDSAEAASGGNSPLGDLAAGQTLRGQLGYQVPNDAKGFQFVFDINSISNGQKVFVDLGQ
ncbi:MAG: DUF4352 domain-containing protein, partial [Negativicutes bacterium]|nr:DUF4352 domain-containing protein [Negativicutes bacterium]